MDQDTTWYGGSVGLRDIALAGWGPSSPSPKGRQTPIFGPCPLWPNGRVDYDATWYGGRPRPRRLCVPWGPRLTVRHLSPKNSVSVRSAI